MKHKKRLFFMAAGLALAQSAVPFHISKAANEAMGTMSVSTTIENSATLSGGSLSISGYIPAGSNDAVATFDLTITNADAYTVSFGPGAGTGATVTNRVLTGTTDPSHSLNYNLYTDAAHTVVWGDGTAGSTIVDGVGTGQIQSLTVYVGVDAGQFPTAQTYSDTVMATVNY